MREFLAIPLPDSLRRAAWASRSVLAPGGDGRRFVREEGLHVTLRFLGEVDPSRRGVRVVRPPVARIGDFGAFVAERVVLYRSELGLGGSTHHEEASYPLIATAAS